MTIEMEYADIWQQFNIDYTHLRGQFLLISKPHLRAEDLNELKSYYTNVINSVRVYDYITSVEQLLRILEKRNVLAYDKIEPLKYISYKYIRDPELERLLRDYECKIVGRSALPLYNVYTLRDGKYMNDQTTRRKSRELIDNIILENDNDNNVYPHNRFTHARGNISSFEDHIIPETATFLPNNVLPLIAERGNDRIFFFKIRDRFRCKNCLGVLAALFGTSLLIAIILMCNKLSVKSSAIAPQPEDQPSTSGIQKRVNATQVYGQLTLHTTQPAFHLTIPASVYVGVPSAVDETAVIRTGEFCTPESIEIIQ